MKKLLVTLAIVILIGLPQMATAKDLKLGYVSIDKIMGASEAAKAVKADIDEKLNVLKKNLKVKEDALRKLVKEYQDQRSIMKDEVRMEKEKELAEKDMEYKQLVAVAERGISEDLKNYDIEMLDDIKAVIEVLGEKKGYDIILDEMMGGIVYIDSKYDDLTDETLKAYDKAFKKKDKK
ncbi:MAG: OmpH family outer membrane protein [Deltaproteobacteria bacterium]|nr:OmpH family outer membrane protein [Deltaproteobacteria bacterium]